MHWAWIEVSQDEYLNHLDKIRLHYEPECGWAEDEFGGKYFYCNHNRAGDVFPIASMWMWRAQRPRYCIHVRRTPPA